MTELNQKGLMLIGKYAGFIQRDGRNKQTNEAWVMHFIGVETPKENGFPGETIVHQVQISKDLVNSGFLNNLKNFEGQEVSASVYVRAYPARGGAAYSLNLTNSMDALQVIGKASSKAA